jgi:hypothetical protein
VQEEKCAERNRNRRIAIAAEDAARSAPARLCGMRVTMSEDREYPERPLREPIVEELVKHIECDAVRRERLYRRQLERTIAVLEHTRHSFRSKQLKNLREEIESVLKTE